MMECGEIWTHDGYLWLADVNHPLIYEEMRQWKRRLGLRYDEQISERHHREFDREMVRKYGALFPPPARTHLVLLSYDIQDAMEKMREEERQNAGVAADGG